MDTREKGGGMKKAIIIVCVVVVGFLGIRACCTSGNNPEDTTKAYVADILNKLDVTTEDLEFEEVTAEDETATVKVTGQVTIDKTFSLVKVDGKWQVGEPEVVAPETEAPAQEQEAVHEAPAHKTAEETTHH